MSFARYYEPGYGFTSLIQFSSPPEEELAPVRDVPHARFTGRGGYDGQYYAQLAVDPLLRDPAIDRALDNPPYRARRILFSWTAWAGGLGQPAWILQAYAVQNAIAWLLVAWLLVHWLPPVSLENFVAWAGCLFGHGLLISVRLALVDGPSLLLILLAVRAAEASRGWLTALLLGVSGLARETNLLAAAGLPITLRWRGVIRLAGQGVLLLLPLLIWIDYLRSIYRAAALESDGHLVMPVATFLRAWDTALDLVSRDGWAGYGRFNLLIVVALTTQLGWLVASWQWRAAWWRVGLAFGALMLSVHWVVWEGYPGAITRVVLPMTVAFNVLLPRGRWFWPLAIAGNLTVWPGLFFFDIPVLVRWL